MLRTFSLLLISILSFNASLCQTKEYKVFYFANGAKSSEGYFEDGQPEGYWRTYYENGILKSEGNRLDHKLDSLWLFYREDGALEKQITYKKNKKNGPSYIYNEEGLLIRKEVLSNDTLVGIAEEYYPEQRKIYQTFPYDDGLINGTSYGYELDGRITSITNYEKGVLVARQRINRFNTKGEKSGIWIEYFEDIEGYRKVKSLEGRYKNGLKNGYFREYDKKGNLLSTTKYVNGEVVENAEELSEVEVNRTFYPDASVHWEKTYLLGVPHGVWKEYNDTGAIVHSQVYEKGVLLGEGIVDQSGIKQGDWKEYYPDGKVRAEGNYKDGARFGNWRFIHENGKLEQKGKYLEGGRPHGLWVWYYDDSELLREMSYRRGKPEGEITEYNDTGKVVLKGSYFDGLEDGEWIIDEGDYLRKGSYVDGLEQGEWLHYYNSNNKVAFKGSYIEGEPHGKHTYYHPNGRKSLEGSYNLGEKIKDWKRYHPDGLLFMTMKYEEGQLIRINGKRVDKKR